MYLSNNSCHLLDHIIKDFEVAYRSFVVRTLKNKFPDKQAFKEHLEGLYVSVNGSTILNSQKYKSKLKNIIDDINQHYFIIEECNNALIRQQIPEESKVPYLSTIIHYVELLFEPSFNKSNLLKGFQTQDFFKLSYDCHKVRNDLAHPASSRISIETSKEVIRLIEKILLNVDDIYFWYSSKDSIRQKINNFLNSLAGPPIAINNISEIAYTHKKLIQREGELNALKELIFGKKGYEFYRKARSIVIYGYGGLGKTALVLEFINEIVKDFSDNNISSKLDFLLYFTAKEEELTFSNSTKEFQINELKKQINSYDTFIDSFYKYLNISSFSELANLKGLLLIDNIETLKGDKERIIEFIKTIPESIQVIITSREEEEADNKIPLKGFEEIGSGEKFIKEYIDEYGLSLIYEDSYKELIQSAKGNTLIIILSLLRLNESPDAFRTIVNELNSTSSSSISTVANFMYKNTFDKAIEEIEEKGLSSKKILSVIAYYNEPIDLYSLSKLTDINNIQTIEIACEILLQKLVLTKKNETYEINEFASKFIIVKIIPDKIEAQFLTNKISEFKFNRRKILRTLEEGRSNDKLNKIMRDWIPRTNIEKIAIAEAYNLFSYAKNNTQVSKVEKVRRIKDKFQELEAYSQHPYIKFQKARIFNILLRDSFNQDYLNIITKSYEDVIFSIKFDYQYIKNTQSFAVVLWVYALFLMQEFNEYNIACRSLEEAKQVLEELKILNENYQKIKGDLAKCYTLLYKKTKDGSYIKLRAAL